MISELSDCRSKDIGEGTNIWQFCVIEELSKIGKNCNICAGCYVESGAVIGNDVTVKCGVQVWRGVEIEDGVFVGPNVTFTNDIFPRSKKHKKEVKTLVKKGASIGANSTILAGVTIGENAMIGAGSVITKDVPKNTLWYGTEATQHAIGKNATFKEDAILVQKLLRERERE